LVFDSDLCFLLLLFLSLSDVCYLSWKTIKATICFSAGVLCVSAYSEKFHKVDDVRSDGLQRWNGTSERPVTGNIPIVISLSVPVPEPRLFLLVSLLKSLLLTSAKKEEDFCLCVVTFFCHTATFVTHTCVQSLGCSGARAFARISFWLWN
jgi:hypothetical protein